MATAKIHRPAAATDAVVTFLAADYSALRILQIDWSFSEDPASAVELTVAVDGTVEYAQYITAAGPGQFEFRHSMQPSKASTSTVITLPSGGGTAVGTLNVLFV